MRYTWRLIARCLAGLVLVAIGLVLLPFVLVVMAGIGLIKIVEAAELEIVYGGDESARDRDRWAAS